MSAPNRYPGRLFLRLLLLFILSGTLGLTRAAPLTAAPRASYWDPPEVVAGDLQHAAHPALAYTRDGAAHAVWESNGQLYYASRPADGEWQVGKRVAAGMSPTILVDADDILHLVFENQFFGLYQIYYMTRRAGAWSLPTNISHTTGVSGEPVLAQTADGTLHAAWMDLSPGYWAIYHAVLENGVWSNQAIENARGKSPTLAPAPNGSLYVAWQDHFPVSDNEDYAFDILISRYVDNAWSLPLNVSDRPDVDSLGAHLTAATNGPIHVTWIDNQREVRYAAGLGVAWSATQRVAMVPMGARGSRIIADKFDRLHIAWDEGNTVQEANALQLSPEWPQGNLVATASGNMREITLAKQPRGGVAMAWIEYAGPGNATIREAQYKTDLVSIFWLPVITQN